jgi:hypothetical protein
MPPRAQLSLQILLPKFSWASLFHLTRFVILSFPAGRTERRAALLGRRHAASGRARPCAAAAAAEIRNRMKYFEDLIICYETLFSSMSTALEQGQS